MAPNEPPANVALPVDGVHLVLVFDRYRKYLATGLFVQERIGRQLYSLSTNHRVEELVEAI